MADIDRTLTETVSLSDSLVQSIGDSHYGSVLGGDNYFGEQITVKAWTVAEKDDKRKALVEATRLIDNLRYKESKKVSTQSLQFPRTSQTAVPKQIEWATYELADTILDEVDFDFEIKEMGVEQRMYSSVKTVYKDDAGVPEHILALIPSIKAWYLIKPYLKVSNGINLARV